MILTRAELRHLIVETVLSEKMTGVDWRTSGGAGGLFQRRRGEPEEEAGVDASKVGKTQGSNRIDALSSEAQPKFREFARLANEAGITIRFTSTHRFPSHQWNLKHGPDRITTNPVAEPCRSDHQYGYAADINATYTNTSGQKIRAKMASNEASWKPVVDIAKQVGLQWLGMRDPVHFYLRNVSSGIKDRCEDFYSEKLGTSDKEGWGSADMAALENDPELRSILGVAESAISYPAISEQIGGSPRLEKNKNTSWQGWVSEDDSDRYDEECEEMNEDMEDNPEDSGTAPDEKTVGDDPESAEGGLDPIYVYESLKTITRSELRGIIIREVQQMSSNPFTTDVSEEPTSANLKPTPVITGSVTAETRDEAVQEFASQHNISNESYHIVCEKSAGGSWSCIANKSEAAVDQGLSFPGEMPSPEVH